MEGREEPCPRAWRRRTGSRARLGSGNRKRPEPYSRVGGVGRAGALMAAGPSPSAQYSFQVAP